MRSKDWIANIEERQMKQQWYDSPLTLDTYQLTKEPKTYFLDSKGKIKVLNIAFKEKYNTLPSNCIPNSNVKD